MLDGLKHALSVPSFRLFLVVTFVGMGLFNGLMTWIDDIVAPRGFGPSEAGDFGDLLLVGGLFGAVAIPALSDRTGKRKPWMLARPPRLAARPGRHGLRAAASGSSRSSAFFLGFFLTSVMPVGMQFATDVARRRPRARPTASSSSAANSRSSSCS